MSRFIVIEGIEGSGKSTLIKGLAEGLAQSGSGDGEIICTREPGATAIGQAIRSILLSGSKSDLDAKAELLLFFADRAQHLAEVIRPGLARGATVLCDRFTYSTLAYQGYGRGIEAKALAAISQFVTDSLVPDCVLLLDLDPKIGLSRAAQRASGSEDPSSWNRFEEEELQFHERIRAGFLEMAKASATETTSTEKLAILLEKRTGAAPVWHVLDAQLPSDELLASSLAFLETLSARNKGSDTNA